MDGVTAFAGYVVEFPRLVGDLDAGFCSGDNRVHSRLGFTPLRVALQRHVKQAQAIVNLVGINRKGFVSDVCPVISVAMPAARTHKTQIPIIARRFISLAIEHLAREGWWKNAFVLATGMFAT